MLVGILAYDYGLYRDFAVISTPPGSMRQSNFLMNSYR